MATFWSIIFVDSSEAFSSLATRSMSASLYIVARPMDRSLFGYMPYFLSHRRGIDPTILNEIVEKSRRVRELCLEGKVSDLQSICKQLRKPLQSPELSRLSSAEPDLTVAHLFPAASLDVIPMDGLTPRLHHLELLTLSVKWTDPTFKCSSLATLVVHGVLDQPYMLHDSSSIGTMPQLLNVLGYIAPGLHDLSLEEAIPPLPLGTAAPPPPERNITFPFLRSLHLVGRLVGAANFFNYLSLPSIASITLKSRKSVDYVTRIGTAGVASVARRLSQHTGGAKPVTSLCIKFVGRTWHVSCFRAEDPEGTPLTLLRIASSYGDHEEMLITALLRGSDNMFAHVQYLSVTGDTFDLDWAFLFACLPKL